MFGPFLSKKLVEWNDERLTKPTVPVAQDSFLQARMLMFTGVPAALKKYLGFPSGSKMKEKGSISKKERNGVAL